MLLENIGVIRDAFGEALMDYNKEAVAKLYDSFASKYCAEQFIDEVMVPVLEKIGKLWEEGALALSQVYLSGRLCDEFLQQVLPGNAETEEGEMNGGKVVGLATFMDNHVLGKKIVSSVLRVNGLKFIDYGHGGTVKQLLDKLIQDRVDILLLSVLMYPSALKIESLRNEIVKRDLKVKILVGGAPFNFDSELYKKVGADAMGKNAAEGVKILKMWLGE